MNKVKNKVLYLIIGINDEGMRETLGFWIAQQETASFWIEVLNDIKSRGVEYVLTIVSDDLPGQICYGLLKTLPWQPSTSLPRSERVFPDDDSLAKVVYITILELESKWTKPIKDWYLIR